MHKYDNEGSTSNLPVLEVLGHEIGLDEIFDYSQDKGLGRQPGSTDFSKHGV